MKTRNQTDNWIYYTTVVLGFVLVTSIASMIVLMFLKQSMSELFVALGIVAGAGLAKLMISPLYRGLIK